MNKSLFSEIARSHWFDDDDPFTGSIGAQRSSFSVSSGPGWEGDEKHPVA